MDVVVEISLAKCCEVLPGIAVKKKLVAHERMGHVGPQSALRHFKFGNSYIGGVRAVDADLQITAKIRWLIEHLVDFLLEAETSFEFKVFGAALRLLSPCWNSARD